MKQYSVLYTHKIREDSWSEVGLTYFNHVFFKEPIDEAFDAIVHRIRTINPLTDNYAFESINIIRISNTKNECVFSKPIPE